MFVIRKKVSDDELLVEIKEVKEKGKNGIFEKIFILTFDIILFLT